MKDADTHFIHELEKLYQYMYGAHHAIDHDYGSQCLHTACHKLDEIIQNIKIHSAKQVAFIATREA